MAITLDGTVGMTAPAGAVYNGLQTTTAQSASTSALLFTAITLWVKRITIMLNGFSASSASAPVIQIGSGSVLTSGYLGAAMLVNTSSNVNMTASGAGWILQSVAAVNVLYGTAILTNINSTNWVIAGSFNQSSTANSWINGSVALSGTLDRVNITTVGGTDPFDAGTVNLIYE